MRITKDNINEFIENSIMDCDYSDITHIDYIPDHIKYLYCIDNKLTSLPKLPECLKYLYCSNNQLTSLPKLPDELRHLNCYDNKLTKLPKLPESLIHLNCYDNKLPYEVTIENLKEHNNKIKLIKRKEILSKICV